MRRMWVRADNVAEESQMKRTPSKRIKPRTTKASRITRAADKLLARGKTTARAKKEEPAALSMPDVTRRPVTLNVSCGSCVFHRRFAVYDHPCHDLGVAAASVPCSRYCVDPTHAAKGEELFKLAAAVGSARNAHLLAAMFASGHRSRRHGFTVGQQVVVRVTPGEYMSNYARGVVIGATTKQVMLAGYDNFTAMLHPSSLLPLDQWRAKRSSLIKAKRVNDPDGVKRIKVKGSAALAVYEVDLMRGQVAKKRGRPPKKVTGADLARKRIKSEGKRTITLSS